MGLQKESELTPNEFDGYLTVVTWVVQNALQDKLSTEEAQENRLKPLVSDILGKTLTVRDQANGIADTIIPAIFSRAIWYANPNLHSFGRSITS